MDEAVAVHRTLHELHGLGVRVAVDDFCAGRSAIGALREFPVTPSSSTADSSKACAAEVAGAIVEIAHALGIEAVAEGVERLEQLAELRAIGCDLGQGLSAVRASQPGRRRDPARERPQGRGLTSPYS